MTNTMCTTLLKLSVILILISKALATAKLRPGVINGDGEMVGKALARESTVRQ